MYFATKPPKRRTEFGDTFLMGRNDLSQVLGVHPGGECRRADEVREHHRDLAALGGVLGLRFSKYRLSRCQSGTRKLSDCAKHFQAVAKRDPEVFEMLIGQLRENREINTVLSETFLVLGHAELFEPVGNLLHRGSCLSKAEQASPAPLRA